jgi:ABC-type phosphate transport system substrate-binding protein
MRTLGKTRWLLLALGACQAARAQDVIIVANPEMRASGITPEELRAIYTGARSQLLDGSHVLPVTLKGGPVHEVFLMNYLKETPDQFRTAWRKAVFTGQGAMPRAFESEALLQFVASTPGALGYVSRVVPGDKVKPLSVLPPPH